MGVLPRYLLLARFGIRSEMLRERGASLVDFVWGQPLQEFIERYSLRSLMERAQKPGLPYRQLNNAMLVHFFPLVHAFETFSFANQSEENSRSRCMLSLETDTSLLPSATDVQHIVWIWAQHWFQTTFPASQLGGSVRQVELLERLHEVVQTHVPTWHQRELYDFWAHREDGRRYRAIPSILAMLLNGKKSSIGGTTVTWHVAVDPSTHCLVVISDPLLSAYPRTDIQGNTHWVEGTFAYKLSFALQTFAGSSEPQLHLFLSCTRYVDDPVTKMNRTHSMTIQARTSKARREGWATTPALIPLSAVTYSGITGLRWHDQLPDLLARLEVRTLADPKEILAAPLLYREPSALTHWDQFFPIFAEGVHPAHAVRTGLGCGERLEIVQEIIAVLEPFLLFRDTLPRDPATARVKKALPLMTHEELRKSVPQSQLATLVPQAIQRALQGKRLTLLVCWYTPRTLNAIRKQLRQILCLADDDPWPQEITVIEHRVSEEMVKPLDSGPLDPEEFYNSARPDDFFASWFRQISKARAQRLSLWEQRVWAQYASESGNDRCVLIELPKPRPNMHRSQSPKGTLRRAALLGWQAGNQMLHPMIPRYDEDGQPLEENSVKSQGRVKNALADLLLRQTGVLFDVPRTIYTLQAQLPAQLAENLTVIGLYCKKAYQTREHPGIHLPLAVRLLPSGAVEMSLPGPQGSKEAWRPYHEATSADLAPRFASGTGLRYSNAESLVFLREIVQEQAHQPTLVIVQAYDWRGKIWPHLLNDRLQDPHLLDMNNPEFGEIPSVLPLTPETAPHLRVVRLRTRGNSGETPQYIVTLEHDLWDQARDARELRSSFGCIDTSLKSSFLHYLSLGPQPKTARKQDRHAYKYGQGGAIAFKYPTILEIVPIFLQRDDEALPWARIAHFLRRSPAWDGGGLLLPYPLHLAQTAVDDCMALFGEVSDGSEDNEEEI